MRMPQKIQTFGFPEPCVCRPLAKMGSSPFQAYESDAFVAGRRSHLIYIRDLLGHVDIATTEIYARIDTELKRKALEKAYPNMTATDLPQWNQDEDLLAWLNSL